MNISILTPTRKRPSFMRRVFDSIYLLADNPDSIEVIFYIDKDDNESIAKYQELKNLRVSTKAVIGDRILLSNMWNECYKISSGEICHHSGDDIIFRTQYWDSIVIREFEKVPDRILFVFGRDGLVDNESLGTHGFIHRNWADVIGYFVPPYFSWCYNDTWLTDVARKINRLRFVPELYIEHMHCSVKKSPWDSTYAEAHARGAKDKCKLIYDKKEVERIANAEKLKEFIRNSKINE